MKRNYGIDLLRLLAMFFVTCLHVLGQGGVLAGAKVLSVNYALAWLLETAAFCAVNCFGLISGYVGVKTKHSVSNLMVLFLQVCSYTVGATLLFTVCSPGTNPIGAMIDSCWPFGKFWYFDAYAVMFLLIPAMNFVLLGLRNL